MHMQIVKNETTAFGLATIQVLMLSFSAEKVLGTVASYYLALIFLCCWLALGVFRVFPFGKNGAVRFRAKEIIVYLVLIGIPLSHVNEMIENGPVQFWFPTANIFWAGMPVLILGAVGGWYYGIGKIER
jgi:hypothetical protein